MSGDALLRSCELLDTKEIGSRGEWRLCIDLVYH